MIVEAFFVQVVSKYGITERFRRQAGVSAGLVQGDGILGCKHSDVGEDGCIILWMAVAIRRNINN